MRTSGKTSRTSCNTWSAEFRCHCQSRGSVSASNRLVREQQQRHVFMALKSPVTLVSCHRGHLSSLRLRVSLNVPRRFLTSPTRWYCSLTCNSQPRLRRQLLIAGRKKGLRRPARPDHHHADQWLCEQHPVEQSIPGRARRELMLVEVLMQHPRFFHGQRPLANQQLA